MHLKSKSTSVSWRARGRSTGVLLPVPGWTLHEVNPGGRGRGVLNWPATTNGGRTGDARERNLERAHRTELYGLRARSPVGDVVDRPDRRRSPARGADADPLPHMVERIGWGLTVSSAPVDGLEPPAIQVQGMKQEPQRVRHTRFRLRPARQRGLTQHHGCDTGLRRDRRALPGGRVHRGPGPDDLHVLRGRSPQPVIRSASLPHGGWRSAPARRGSPRSRGRTPCS